MAAAKAPRRLLDPEARRALRVLALATAAGVMLVTLVAGAVSL